MRTLRFLFCAALLFSVGVSAKTALTQDPTDERFDRPAKPKATSPKGMFQTDRFFDEGSKTAQPRPDEIPRVLARPRRVTRAVTETILEPIPPEELEAHKKLQAAIQQLSTGKDEESRKEAADTIQQQLTIQFEADLKQREKELAEVEQRVKSLREQLNKRKAAQADIINLRLQTLVNNANGLGFPGSNLGTGEVDLFTPESVVPGNVPVYLPGSRPFIGDLDPVAPSLPKQKFEDAPLDDSETKRFD